MEIKEKLKEAQLWFKYYKYFYKIIFYCIKFLREKQNGNKRKT